VVRAADGLVWQRALDRFEHNDVYFLPEYHMCCERNGDGTALAFVAEQQAECLFYPFFLRPIRRVGSELVPRPAFDLETVYGYTGPLSTTTAPEFLAEAWQRFEAWCRDQYVVAEFLRFNPFLVNHVWAGPNCLVSLDRQTAAIRLRGSEAELWSRYPSVQRNMVRKALSKGLTCGEVPLDQGLPSFQALYAASLERLHANAYYSFSPDYFACLSEELMPRMKLFFVRHDDQVAAAALFLIDNVRIHYHLAANNPEYGGWAANNLMLHTVALWACQAGCEWLHLGGGRTAADDDSLFRFKAGISTDQLDFRIGRRVHNQVAYKALCSTWMRQSQAIRRPDYFLLYRMPIEA
jgi:hypothetical protein